MTPAPRRATTGRRFAVAGLLAALAGCWLGLGPAGAEPAAAAVRPVAPRPALAAAVTTLPSTAVVFGDERPSAYLRRLREAQLGVRSAIVGSFARWDAGADFPAVQSAATRATGAVPMIAWTSAGITLDEILGGDHDAYVTNWAQGAAAYGHPVLVRLFPEMNCGWSWWSPGVHGNTAEQFVAAWHHVVGEFRAAGADNVRFVWNVGYSCDTDLQPLWPGATWVDYTGIDVYNWAEPTAERAEHGLRPMLDRVRALGPKVPVILPEVGSSHVLGSPGPWLAELVRLSAQEGIRAIVYFDEDRRPDHPDWRLGSDDPFVPRLRAVPADVRAAVHRPSVVTAGSYTRAAIESYLMARPPSGRLGSSW